MKPERVDARISLYDKGAITAYEVAVGLLVDLVRDSELDTAILSSISKFADEIKHEMFSLLRKIELAEYHWAPPYLGPAPPSSEPPGQAERLRQICSVLFIGQSKD